MNRNQCDNSVLADLLLQDCDVTQQRDVEAHLEYCTVCQSQLAKLAADEQLWTRAASHLSTIEEIELPKQLAARLNNSSSFVVPTFSDEPAASGPFTAESPDSSWTRILDPPSHPEMLGRIDQFEVDAKIGEGGMGIVLKGFDRELNRAVAIKVLSPHLAVNGTARKRFAREAESAAAVMHPNVVPIYSVNKSTDRPYIVMQLVPGHSLQSLVAEKGPLEPKEIVRISMQIASGLAAAHKQGLIHRDVKPGNILIEHDVSRAMITDFGLARAVDDAGMTQTGWLAGTPHYMSPEQSKGDELDARTDLFSLGSLMYFLATGREPFRGDKPYVVIQKIITQQPTHPSQINSEIPPALAEIIEKLLEKDPKDRFASANVVFETLQEYLAYLQQPTKLRPPKRILTARRKRRRAWLGGLGLAIALTGISLLAWVLTSKPTNPIEPPNGPGTTPALGSDSSSESGNSLPRAISPSTTNMFDEQFSQQFADELANLSVQLDTLEQGIRETTIPFSQTSGASPDGLKTRMDLFDSQLKSIEMSFELESRQFLEFIESVKHGLLERIEDNNEQSLSTPQKGTNDEN